MSVALAQQGIEESEQVGECSGNHIPCSDHDVGRPIGRGEDGVDHERNQEPYQDFLDERMHLPHFLSLGPQMWL